MTPLSFNFGSSDAIATVQRRLVVLVEDAIAALGGPGVAAALVGCTAAQLRDALDGRNNRRLPTEWVLAIARQVGGDYRDRILALITQAADPGEPASDAQFIAALIEGYGEHGRAGAETLAAIRRRCKR